MRLYDMGLILNIGFPLYDLRFKSIYNGIFLSRKFEQNQHILKIDIDIYILYHLQ